jgi:glyoxylase-like metal-dependent hydrolase (beta-lactamase superfamily II)
MIHYKIYNSLPEYGTNTYLIWDDDTLQAILVDVSAPNKQLVHDIEKMKLQINAIILTHGHADHIGGVEFFANHFYAPIWIHKNDEDKLTDAKKNLSSYMGNEIIMPPANKFVEDNEKINLGKSAFKIIHTPGHTTGGICLLFDTFLISGDTLFCESIGRTDLPGGNYEILIKSIKDKLFTLDESLIVLPGHGESTTIENEKIGNPFVGLAARL